MRNNTTTTTTTTTSYSTSTPSDLFPVTNFSYFNYSDNYFYFDSNYSDSNNNHKDTNFWDKTWNIIYITNILSRCSVHSGTRVWLGLKIFTLLTALPSNGALMWLLLKTRSTLSPSQVLAFNISIMDVLYCLYLPFDIYATLHETLEIIHEIHEFVSALKTFGCPLLLTFMCMERYVAAAFPITYLHLGKWNNRIILCVLAWILTLVVAILLYFFQKFAVVLALAVIISILFLIMLLCLVGIMRVLCQNRPGDGASGSDSLKKRALINVLMVIVPSVIAYTPLIAAVPYLSAKFHKVTQNFTSEECTVLQVLWAFPNLGLYIGPMFYLSWIQQITCCKKEEEGETQAE